jgi:predicted Rossmann-fold nucleotide-binding protein
MVITGAGEGIMKAGQGGAGRDQSFGVNIRLPFEQSANEIIQNDAKLITFRYFFTRKLVFVKETDAIALFPGGFGTMDEAFETLTLLQTGKSPLLPLVCVDREGGDYWRSWDTYIRKTLLSRGLIADEDLSLYRVVDRLDEATSHILTFYRNYHSSRYVGNRLVLRLHRIPSLEAMARLEREYADIVAEGKFSVGAALPEEAEDSAVADLPRLAFVFNRRSFGRLRQLIDTLNQLAPSPEAAPAGCRAE